MTLDEAIERIKDHMIIHKMNEPRAIKISEALDMAIKALEQEQDKWIPVSKRLPDKSGEYLVSYDYNAVDIVWYAHPNDYNIEKGEWREITIESEVIAWMPLPKPYNAESEGEE